MPDRKCFTGGKPLPRALITDAKPTGAPEAEPAWDEDMEFLHAVVTHGAAPSDEHEMTIASRLIAEGLLRDNVDDDGGLVDPDCPMVVTADGLALLTSAGDPTVVPAADRRVVRNMAPDKAAFWAESDAAKALRSAPSWQRAKTPDGTEELPSGLPPGYAVDFWDDEWWWSETNSHDHKTRASAIAAAWAHYNSHPAVAEATRLREELAATKTALTEVLSALTAMARERDEARRRADAAEAELRRLRGD